MTAPDLNRRDFHKLTMAAFGGIVAGAAGCSRPPEEGADAPAPGESAEPASEASSDAESKEPSTVYLTQEPHVCRGLNTCKGKGKGGDNDCAGQGSCHTATAHDCHYENDCKGQGGCSDIPGQNACKELGNCAVPLGQPTWERARKAFEAAMQEAGNKVGAAPAAS